MHDQRNEPAVAQQAVHGYESGHRLLASSVSFDPPDQRSLLIMSDLSGPRLAEGFLEYLTAYPLPSGKYYAIAKTWYASEMERPGCVWTHTLLVKSEDIGNITDGNTVLKLFRRPRTGTEKNYSEPVQLGPEMEPIDYSGLTAAGIENSSVQGLIHQLYSKNEIPVAQAAETGIQFEKLALVIWTQQWPQLRLNFSFCTGSLSERTLNSRSLDLQFGPLRVVRNFAVRDAASKVSNWSQRIAEDLFAGSQTPMRDFLRKIGGDLRERTDFSKVVDVYEMFLNGEAGATLAAVQLSYPDREQARCLKHAVGGEKGLFQHCEGVLLRSFVELSDTNGFDAQDLEIRKRAGKYLVRDRLAALKQARRALELPSNAMRDQFISGVTPGFTVQDFEQLAQSDSNVLLRLARIQPDVAYLDEFWGADFSVDDKVEIFRFLSKKRNWKVRPAVEALLRTRNNQAATFLASELEEDQVDTVLNWAAQTNDIGTLLRPEWLGFFREHQGAVVEWYSNEKVLPGFLSILLAQVVDPFSMPKQLSLEKLAGICEAGRQLFPQRHEVAAFIYVAASRYTEAQAATLAVSAFPTLHQAMAESRLSYRAWQIVDPLLPIIDRDWGDNCEKLRRSILSLFDAREWPIEELWKLLERDDHLFSDMVKTAKQFVLGRTVFHRLFLDIETSRLSATSRQFKELKKLLR